MKKMLLLLVCAVFAFYHIQAQEFLSANGVFAERKIDVGKSQNEVDGFQLRLGSYAQQHAMYPGETLQEAVARASSPMGTMENVMQPEDLTPTFSTTSSWGTVFGIDPSSYVPQSLFYTQTMERTEDGWYYKSVEFVFYDDKFTELYRIPFDLPYKCNHVRVSEDFSGALWDTSASNGLEFVFMVHYFEEPSGPETQIYDYYVYRSNGDLLATLSNVVGVFQYYDGSSSRLIIDKWLGYGSDKIEFEVYEARKYLTNPEVKASHEFNLYTTVGLNGPVLSIKNVDNQNYYYIAHYELPYWETMSPDWLIQQDNNFLIEFYNIKTYEKAKSFTIPFPQTDPMLPTEACYGIDFAEYDTTSKTFNEDDKWELVFGINQYITSCDCYRPTYSLINEDGEVLKTLPYMISSAMKMKDLPGHETQYALLQDSGNGITAISFLDLPSWTYGATLQARHEGELLSLNFGRFPIEDGEYAYIFGMGESYQEEDMKYNKVNWYKSDGSLYKDHRIYMTGDDYFFEPQIAASTLNPFLFNSDEKMEYIGFCGTLLPNSETLISLRVYNEDSELLFRANDDDTKGAVSAGLYTVSNAKQWEYLILSYASSNNVKSYEFYPLPLVSFEEGDGTIDNPYVIRTAGDFDLIRNNPEASYILANDIDFETLLASKYATGWVPIPSFSGTLDGNGHTIRNFNIAGSSEYSISLIGNITMPNAATSDLWIKNLSIEDSQLKINSDNSYVSFLAGNVSGPFEEGGPAIYLENIHIKGDIIDDGASFPSRGTIGALAQSVTYSVNVSGCSFEGTISNDSPSTTTSTVGGLIAKVNNNVVVENCFSKGNISISNANRGEVGGIIGNFSNTCKVSNCYSTMDLKSFTNVGGIIGSSSSSEKKGLVENCYASGTILSEAPTGNYFAGGVIGSTTGNWEHREIDWETYEMTIKKIKENEVGLVALNPKVTAPYANRVVGLSNDAMALLDEFGIGTLDSLKNCYAINTMLIGKLGEEAAITSDDDTYIEGADVTQSELTKDFYTGIGWKFGENAASPWVWNENGNPRLYIEFKVRSIAINMEDALIDPTETVQLSATVAPADAWNTNVTWSTSDDKIATVDETGLVTGIDFGVATITAISEDGEYKATCEVKVGRVEGIMFNKSALTLVAGKDETLSVGSTPAGSAIGELVWSSSDKSIALVDSNGRVTGVAIGSCVVTATMKNTDLTASCEVTIIGAESITLNKHTLALGVGANETLVATIDPADGMYTDLTWESSDNTIATVNAFGKVTGVKAGTCTIKVKLDGTDLFDTCEVIVSAPDAIDNPYASEVSVYPNPTTDKLYVKNAEGEVRLLDISGKLLEVVKANGQEATIDMSAYEKGVYLVNTGKAMIKVIRN